MEADFLNYKTLFEESNITMEKISDKLDSKISELTDLLEEFDIKGKNVIMQPHTVFWNYAPSLSKIGKVQKVFLDALLLLRNYVYGVLSKVAACCKNYFTFHCLL